MEGRLLVAITDQARENREYVRTLLRRKQPEFAALLESLELELPCLSCPGPDCGSSVARSSRSLAKPMARSRQVGSPTPASGTGGTAASVQTRRVLAVMPGRRRREMLVESRTGPFTGSMTAWSQPVG
jgi:hypothetical protein